MREYTSTFHKKFGRAKITASLLNLGGSLLLQGWHLTYVQLWRRVSPFVVTLKKKLRNLLKIRFDGISRCRMRTINSPIQSLSLSHERITYLRSCMLLTQTEVNQHQYCVFQYPFCQNLKSRTRTKEQANTSILSLWSEARSDEGTLLGTTVLISNYSKHLENKMPLRWVVVKVVSSRDSSTW